MKRFVVCVLALLLCVLPAYGVSAQSAILLDGITGEVLFEQNGDQELPMASTTKIMTAVIAIEQGDIDRKYKVRKEYTLVEGSSMYLREGEMISLRDTLYGLLLMSGNDAALAIAGECGGKERFVADMNRKARELGLHHTHFENPNGLDGDTHYTTAHELALLAAYAMENPVFREIVATTNYTSDGHTMVNHNRLLRLYEGAVGVKTGFTKKSGRCLVSAAERGGRRLIAVTLHASNDWNEHMVMLNDGFAKFTKQKTVYSGEPVGTVTVYGGNYAYVPLVLRENITLNLRNDEQPEMVLLGRNIIYAPVFEGACYGKIQYRLKDKVLAEANVYYAKDSLPVKETQTLFDRIRNCLFG